MERATMKVAGVSVMELSLVKVLPARVDTASYDRGQQ
jgi:hypothetical protein